MPIDTVQVVIIALILLLLVLTLFGGVIKDIIPWFSSWWGRDEIIVPIGFGKGDATCERSVTRSGGGETAITSVWYIYDVTIKDLRVEGKGLENIDVMPVLFFKDVASTAVDLKSTRIPNLPSIIKYHIYNYHGPTRADEIATLYFFRKNDPCYDLGQGYVTQSEFLTVCGSYMTRSVGIRISAISGCEEPEEMETNCKQIGTSFGEYACAASRYNCYWDVYSNSCGTCEDVTGRDCTLVSKFNCKCNDYCHATTNILMECTYCEDNVRCEDLVYYADCVANVCKLNCYFDKQENKCRTCDTDFSCGKIINKGYCMAGACGKECEWNGGTNTCIVRTEPVSPSERIR